MNAVARLDAEVVREAARDRWLFILASLGIEVTPRKHTPCPACGGRDRFRFDDLDGRGTFYCNQCGAGDGLALVMKMCGRSFSESLRLVAGILGLTSSEPAPRPRLTPQPLRVDRVALAFRFDLAALDHRLRAERILEAATGLDASRLNENELDRSLRALSVAYQSIERAELFEGVADALRLRAWRESRCRP